MKNHIKNFGQFINENVRLRSKLVGGKGHKREYDALSPDEKMELEDLFASLSMEDERSKMLLRNFVSSLSKYNSIGEIKSALNQVKTALSEPDSYDEPTWSISRSATQDGGSNDGGYYYGN